MIVYTFLKKSENFEKVLKMEETFSKKSEKVDFNEGKGAPFTLMKPITPYLGAPMTPITPITRKITKKRAKNSL